jgi:hypothetical protein
MKKQNSFRNDKKQLSSSRLSMDNNTSSYFTSPFKRFTRFSGTPSPTRYPMRSPSYRHNASASRPSNPRKFNYANDAENKSSWYKAGARFGQQKRNKEPIISAASTTPSSDTPITTPATPPPTPVMSAEPDLISGQMRKMSMS